MKIVSAEIYALNIPFVGSFGHHLKVRNHSDSIVVKLNAKDVKGFGEGIARPYVTGETVKKSIKYIKNILFPLIKNVNFPDPVIGDKSYKALNFISSRLPSNDSPGVIAWNASRTAVELAVIDCLLKRKKISLNSLLPVKSKTVTYSGIIPFNTVENVAKIAKYYKSLGIKNIKIKVKTLGDYSRIEIIRDIMGPSVSIRLDANCAFNVKDAVKFISSVVKYNIECFEQPVPRNNISELAEVKANSPVQIMADESLVTVDDAKRLIEYDACDYFNLRISKCGGLYNTLLIADIAERAGMKIQLGCQVGETAILSAAGRHLAAHLSNLRFVEGSYSKMLLVEDISRNDVKFGYGGKASGLTGYGLGVDIDEERLKKYAREIITVN